MGFGSIIRHHRKKKGWDREELAEKIGRTYTIISNWEKEKTMPGPLDLFRLADLLHISASYILGLSETPFELDIQDIDEIKLCLEGRELTKKEQTMIKRMIIALLEEDEHCERGCDEQSS